MPIASQFPVVDITSFGPCLHYDTLSDGTMVAWGLYGPDEIANESVIGLVNYVSERMWRLLFQNVLFSGDATIVQSIETNGGNMDKVYAGADGTNTWTWTQLFADQGPQGQPVTYDGEEGSDGAVALFNSFMASVTTQSALSDTTQWRNQVLLAAAIAGFNITLNITPIPAAGNPTGPVAALPAAQKIGGIPTAAALWLATNSLGAPGSQAAPLPGSGLPWSYAPAFIAPPASP